MRFTQRRRARKRRPAPAVSPAQQAAEDAKFEPSSQAEAYVLQFLGVLFVLIILEGLALAGSVGLPIRMRQPLQWQRYLCIMRQHAITSDVFRCTREETRCRIDSVGVIVQGFLPEAADAFIVDRIYPTFSPQLGVLFACSTVYGLWKVSNMR